MKMIVNGETREAPDSVTLTEYLAGLNLRPQMVVVERNGEIVPRDQYTGTALAEGDVLEIVQMMAGG